MKQNPGMSHWSQCKYIKFSFNRVSLARSENRGNQSILVNLDILRIIYTAVNSGVRLSNLAKLMWDPNTRKFLITWSVLISWRIQTYHVFRPHLRFACRVRVWLPQCNISQRMPIVDIFCHFRLQSFCLSIFTTTKTLRRTGIDFRLKWQLLHVTSGWMREKQPLFQMDLIEMKTM